MRPMSEAPKDGTKIRAFGKYTPKDGIIVCWPKGRPHDWNSGIGWSADQGLAAFEFDGWEPIDDKN